MSDILHRVGIKSTPDQVCNALATRDGLAGWWTTSTKRAVFMMSLKSLVETGEGALDPNDVKIDNWN